jgi:histidine phosphotransfer protein HptB
MATEDLPLIEWTAFGQTRRQLDTSFIRILGYFFEDGIKAIDDIEAAMRNKDAAALVLPAHKLKSEARQFGGERLGQLAEDIEVFARHCLEMHESPDDYVAEVVKLRPLFAETMAAIEAEANPLKRREPGAGFGRKVA